MPFNDALATPTTLTRDSVPPKGTGKRKKGQFRPKSDKGLFDIDVKPFSGCRILHPNRVLPKNAPATTTRGNDGMSYVW